MGRVVVERRQGCRPDRSGEGDGLVERTVAPADPARPLVGRLLRIVDEQVDALQQLKS